jgi:translation initiation factor IF-2
VFNITKVGTIAGCFVRDGRILRASKVRLIRDGIVIHTGTLPALKRFKDDVKEVVSGLECGVMIKDYQNIQENDIIEVFEEIESVNSSLSLIDMIESLPEIRKAFFMANCQLKA